MNIYLDNSATTKLDKEVLKEMLPYLQENYGNPSSTYQLGRENKKIIEHARKQVAKVLNADTNEIYFTSGGSESDNMALKGVAFANQNKGKHIITSKIEHLAVLETCKELEKHGFEITYINVDKNGIVDLKQLEASIRKDTILISIMFANNEIGTIEPIKNIGMITKQHNILFHTDSVQAIGNIEINVKKLGIDLLSLSAHKFYGPKGIGALYVRDGIDLRKYLNGGHQENNMRAGTENVAGIVGLGKAITLAYNNIKDKNKKLHNLRTYLINEIKKNIPNIEINGTLENRLPGNINILIKGIESDNLLTELDKKGIFISTGSACTTGNIESSHVLKAIGLSDIEAHSSIRISLGKYNTKNELKSFFIELKETIENLRKHSVLYK